MAGEAWQQAPAYYADGTPIPAEKLTEAVAAGEARFRKGARVYVRTEGGALGTVSAADAAHQNVTVLSPEQLHAEWRNKEFGGLGAQAQAGVEGAARGLTLGGSDLLASKLSPELAERMKERKEAHPLTAVTGEVGGAILPLLATGGESGVAELGEGAELAHGAEAVAGAGEAAEGLHAAETARAAGSAPGLASRALRAAGTGPRLVAKAGTLVEHAVEHGLEHLGYEGATLPGRVLARGASLAAGGAVEGGLYGAGNAVSEAALNNEDITAEKFVAGLGHGALFGGLLGAGIGAGGELGSAALSKVVGAKKDALEHFANQQAIETIGSDAQIKKIGGRSVGEEASQKIQAEGKQLLEYKFKTGEQAGENLFQAGDSAKSLVEKLDYARRETGAQLDAIKQSVEGITKESPALAPNVDEYLARVRAEVIDPLKASKSPGTQRMAKAVERELSVLSKESGARAQAAELGVANEAAPAAPGFADLEKFRQDLRGVFQPQAPPGGGLPPPPPKSAKYLERAERILSDYLKDKAGAALEATGENAGLYRDLNRQYSSLESLTRMAQKRVNLGNRSLSLTDHGMGMMGFLSSVISGHPVGAALGFGASAVANKLLREHGNSVIAVMAKRASEMDSTIERTAHHFGDKAIELSGIVGAEGQEHGHEHVAPHPELHDFPKIASNPAQLEKQYAAVTQKLAGLQPPQTMQRHITGLTAPVTMQYPQLSTAIGMRLSGMLGGLAQAQPSSLTAPQHSLTPLAGKPRVSPVDMRKYLATVRGAIAPAAVIADISDGKNDRDGLAAVKQFYPKTFEQLRNKVADYVGERETELPYAQRIQLSLAFDFTGDSSLDPQRMAGLQQAVAQQQAGEQQRSPSPGKSKLGASFDVPSSTTGKANV